MKIALLGYGKMGKFIEKIAVEAGHEIVLKINLENKDDLTSEKITWADVAIEFSSPESAFDNISFCLDHGIPIVSGTTGWLDRKPEVVTKCEENNGTFFYASNYSIGVNLFFALNDKLAEMMNKFPQYDPTMLEIHHTEKRDAPSGTAITLAERLINNLDRKKRWENGESNAQDTLVIQSERTPDVPGTHSINYQSAIDSIEIIHTAYSREGFAKGALMAAEWLIGKKGFFGMKDLLGF